MLERLIDSITRVSLRFKWVTIALSLLFLGAGGLALTQLNQELLPEIEFPQTIVLVQGQGLEAEEMRDLVTIPIEEATRDITGIVNIETTTTRGVSLIVLRSEFGLALADIQAEVVREISALDFPEGVGEPELLNFSFADLPVISVSASSPELSLDELKTLIEAEVVPALSEVDEVANVEVRGGQELPEAPESRLDCRSGCSPAGSGRTSTGLAAPERQEEENEPVELPASWQEAAAGFGVTLETTAELSPLIIRGIASSAPDLLNDLTPEMLLATPPRALAALPAEYIESLDEPLQAEIARRIESAAGANEGIVLPPSWTTAAAAMGITLETTAELDPQIIEGIGRFAPQLLEDLTPEMLFTLTPETLAALPGEYLAALDEETRGEIVRRIEAAGLEVPQPEEEETGTDLPADAPQLGEEWLQPPENNPGAEPQFQNAADLINNGFAPTVAEFLNLLVTSGQPNTPELLADLSPEVVAWLEENEEGFLSNLSPAVLRLLSQETLQSLPETFYDSLDPSLREELEGIAAGTREAFIPTDIISRLNGSPSLVLSIYKESDANTVEVSHRLFDALNELEERHDGLTFNIAFEQASFIEESISGVAREGTLGAIFAIVVILIFLSGRVNGRYVLSWRSTLVTAVSIPLSILMAFALMRWLPPVAHLLLDPIIASTRDVPVLGTLFEGFGRLFPVGVTLNIMTLSGMTVAIGRVVDDSIVVLENIYRHIQRGDGQRESVLVGTRDVAVAIFASTITTVVVFLPIGLIGGLIGEFFLPFGVAVSYALLSSFLVAVTTVPVLAYQFIRKEHLPPENETSVQRLYTPILEWALHHRLLTLLVAGLLFAGSMWLLAQRPRAFIPDLGEVRITTAVDLPDENSMADTLEKVIAFEEELRSLEGLGTISSQIGSGGVESQLFGGSIDPTRANIEIGLEAGSNVETLTASVRSAAAEVFGAENVTVSAGTLSSSGFGGFSLVLTGEQEALTAINDEVLATLEAVDGLANVSSNLASEDTILRVDGQRALRYSGEVESEDALGVTADAREAVEAMVPAGITVSEGFESRQQTEGFAQAGQAVLISIVAVYVVLVLTFASFVNPFTILFSLPMATIGAAIALWLTNRVLGLSAMVGLMMLVGIVVTNAIVLIDRVHANREQRGMGIYDALVEAGRTRLRPILMTAIAAMLALVPLALGLTEGAIIAAELATVVIGGLFSSTFLTLLVVPVMYSLLNRMGGDAGESGDRARG